MPKTDTPQFHLESGYVLCRDCPFTGPDDKQTFDCTEWSLDDCPTAETYAEACLFATRRLVAFTSRINGAVKREVEA